MARLTRVEKDAAEFGVLANQGGWRLGLLVARNVEKGKGDGVRKGSAVTTVKADHRSTVSAQEFGRLSGTSGPRVLRYLKAWQKAADAGHVPHVPADDYAPVAEKLPPWEDFYDATAAGGRPRDAKPADAVTIIKRATPEQRAEIVQAAAVELAEAMEDRTVAEAITAESSQKALDTVGIASSTESYLRKKAAETPPPADAASHKLGGMGPGAMADKIHNETMEPAIDRVKHALWSAQLRWQRHGFRLALTEINEFDELDDEMKEIGRLYAEMLDLYDAAKAAKIANETEGAAA